MVTAKASMRPARATPKKERPSRCSERQRLIQGAIWTFEVEGIRVTREEAEKALEISNSRPLPDI